jgi:leucyl-tRNA synthetase
VNPNDVVDEFGADALRCYEMFMGPLEQVKPWQTSGVQGVYRFLERTWRLFVDEETGATKIASGPLSADQKRALHVAIKEATEGIAALRLNTPLSKMMELVNAMKGQPLPLHDARAFLLVLHPWAPHVANELWERLGLGDEIYGQPWPAWDPAALEVDTVEIAVQVNGKLRGTFPAPKAMGKDALLAHAKAHENVARHLEGKTILKEIVVPGKLVNLVVT